jgi:hypothetical protein
MEVRVLDRRHLNVCILVDDSSSRVPTEENPGDRNSVRPVADSDIGTHRQIVHQAFYRGRRTGRTQNCNRLGAPKVVLSREQACEAPRMVAMRISNKDRIDSRMVMPARVRRRVTPSPASTM